MFLLVVAIQGFVLSAIVFFNKKTRGISVKVLTALLIIFSLILLEEGLELLDYNSTIQKITGATFLADLLLGPLAFLYASALVGKNKAPALNLSAHLAFPVVLNLLYWPYHFLVSWDNHLINSESLKAAFIGLIVVKIGYQFVYQVLAIRTLQRFLSRANLSTVPKAQLKLVKWLKNILIAVVVLIPVVLLFEGIGEAIGLDSDYITSLIMLASIYSIGYIALKNPLVYARQEDDLQRTAGKTDSKGPKYKTSSLSDADKKNGLDKLMTYMDEEKPYLTPDYTFDDMVSSVGLARHHLSQLLNEVIDQNFYDFINSYRVKEVIRRIDAQEYKDANILTLGLESGFNSKATLNRAFKKVTGTTPLSYIKDKEGTEMSIT